MERLFLFIYQFRAFFTFVGLELACVWMIVSSNHYQRAMFFNSSGALVANMNSFTYNIQEYFSLRETNLSLAEENTLLREELEKLREKNASGMSTSSTDSKVVNRWEFISARVVNNSVSRYTNFITVNKGSQDGIKPGMAVISGQGVVGKIKSTSEHFSVLTSLLNIDVMVSAMIKRTGHFGTIRWEGRDPRYVSLLFIPPHVNPVVGDTVITSSYNAIFPPDVLIGTIEEVKLNEAALFYDLKVKLAQDFQKLRFVEVVKSHLKPEQDSLETSINVPVK